MYPLSCANCCHNPLQLGPVGYPVGYCTRQQCTLLAPASTTCGDLQRCDLQRERAEVERETHARTFTSDHVADLATRRPSALTSSHLHPALQRDVLIREVRDYGLVSEMSTLATLRRMSGVRAEIALTNLGRAHFALGMRRQGTWTSGLHLAWWMLERLADEPTIELHDLRDESALTLDERFDLATWYVVAARLLLLLDVSTASQARARTDGLHRISQLVVDCFERVPAGSGRKLTRFLASRRGSFAAALPETRYRALVAEFQGVTHEGAQELPHLAEGPTMPARHASNAADRESFLDEAAQVLGHALGIRMTPSGGAKARADNRMGTFATNVKVGVVATDEELRVHLHSTNAARHRELHAIAAELASRSLARPSGALEVAPRSGGRKHLTVLLEHAWRPTNLQARDLARVTAMAAWLKAIRSRF